MVVGGDARVHIGVGAEARGIAVEDALAQRVDVGRHLDRVALALHRLQRVDAATRTPTRKAAVPVLPAFGGKLNSTIATLRSARSARRSATSLATRAASISARSVQTCMSRALSLPGKCSRGRSRAGHAGASERPPKTIGPVAPSSSGMATIMVALDRQQAALRAAPLLQRLELDRMRREVGHVERARASPRRAFASL